MGAPRHSEPATTPFRSLLKHCSPRQAVRNLLAINIRYGDGRGRGVGRSRGIGFGRGVGVGRTVAVGVAVGVGVALGLGVTVGVEVGVGVPPPP